jgi:hypothetical protein
MPPLAIAPLVAPLSDTIWRMSPPVRVDGDTLRTWTITDEGTERVQLSIRSAGRPVEAKVELWQSPSFIPVTFTYCFDSGSDSPLHTIIETPGLRKTIAVYNTECGHCPFEASVAHTGLGAAYEAVAHHQPELVQGGKTTSYTFGPEVESVQVLLKTDGRNMKALIEVLQGPGLGGPENEQTIEVDVTSGLEHPFYVVIQTPAGPGLANTLRIINLNPVEFPFHAFILPYTVVLRSSSGDTEIVMGHEGSWAV